MGLWEKLVDSDVWLSFCYLAFENLRISTIFEESEAKFIDKSIVASLSSGHLRSLEVNI